MKNLNLILVVMLSGAFGSAHAQPPATSPALDPNYIVLQPYQKAERSNGSISPYLGNIVNNVGPMEGPDDKFGDVFLTDVPHAVGYDSGGWLFAGGPQFSISPSERPLLQIHYGAQHQRVFFHGSDRPPDLLTEHTLLPAFNWLRYQDTATRVIGLGITFQPGGADSGGYIDGKSIVLRMPRRKFDDIVTFGGAEWNGNNPTFRLTSYIGRTALDSFTWYGRARATPHFQVYLPSPLHSKELHRIQVDQAVVIDVNRDSIPDICALIRFDSTSEDSNRVQYLYTILGKRLRDSTWGVDTAFWQAEPFGFIPIEMKVMDFLKSDGVPDLLISTPDTIYCYDGNRLESLTTSSFELRDAALKIPSPLRADPANFGGPRGRGRIYNWATQLLDLDNVNGSGDRSIGTSMIYQPDTASIVGASYFFIYSGGKAADERADAVVYDDTSPVDGEFANFDTVQTGLTDPTGFLIGTPGYYGGQGLLWFFKGDTRIPHVPDPRWLNGVVQTSVEPQQTEALRCFIDGVHIAVTLPDNKEQGGRLTLRNLLGQALAEIDVHLPRTRYDFDMAERAAGLYLIELNTERSHTLTRVAYIR